MTTTSITLLLVSLVCLIFLSAFFSSSETGMMSLNRYRLRHKANEGQKSAQRVARLLVRPDRLLGVILIGNTFANVLASAVATVIAVRLYGDLGVAIGTMLLTLALLIFAEVTPKTVAALYPERIAYPASWLLSFLLKLFYPLVWVVNGISNAILRLFRVHVGSKHLEMLSHEELRTLINESVGKKSSEYRNMLLGILDLGGARVEDIMIPRSDIIGVDLEDDWSDIVRQISKSPHTRLPLFEGSVESTKSILHLRKVLPHLADKNLDKTRLKKLADKAYFIPEATPLNLLLTKMRQHKERMGIVVDEYGDILGLATLDDILEEIVGEFTTDLPKSVEEVVARKDGCFEVDGGANLRELNRDMGWDFPIDGPKTLSGLIIEQLEMIPHSNICVRISGYPIEVVVVEDNMIKSVKIWPELKQ